MDPGGRSVSIWMAPKMIGISLGGASIVLSTAAIQKKIRSNFIAFFILFVPILRPRQHLLLVSITCCILDSKCLWKYKDGFKACVVLFKRLSQIHSKMRNVLQVPNIPGTLRPLQDIKNKSTNGPPFSISLVLWQFLSFFKKKIEHDGVDDV